MHYSMSSLSGIKTSRSPRVMSLLLAPKSMDQKSGKKSVHNLKLHVKISF